MTTKNQFVLDANVFIEAYRRYYAFDLAPKFWESLIEHANRKNIFSIDRVFKELERGKDELAKWAKKDFSHGFVSTDEDNISKCYGDIITWVYTQYQFTDAAKANFATVADGWLVAIAKINDLIVVTHEQFRPEVKTSVPIPNICNEIGVQYIDTFEMLRKLKVKFS